MFKETAISSFEEIRHLNETLLFGLIWVDGYMIWHLIVSFDKIRDTAKVIPVDRIPNNTKYVTIEEADKIVTAPMVRTETRRTQSGLEYNVHWCCNNKYYTVVRAIQAAYGDINLIEDEESRKFVYDIFNQR